MLSSQLFCLLGLLATGALAWNTSPTPGQSFHSPLPGTRDLREQFKAFQIQYNKSYPDAAERERRFKIFADNLAQAQQLTEEHQGLAQFGVTQFSDLTEEEFRRLYQPSRPDYSGLRVKTGGYPRLQRPKARSCDWRKARVLTPVRDQKNCNSCWAISAVGNVEALWAIKYQQLFELSVQELLDCRQCGKGCEGGFVWDAYMTILNQSGLAEEQDYPYRPQLSKSCQNKEKRAWIHDFLMLKQEENHMAQYVAENGPITVTINSRLLGSYRKGVIKPGSNCDPEYLDHVVLLVGFGQIHNFTYWILKNSWGSSWGEKGYFRLHRGSNACGITKYPLTALVRGQNDPMRCPS
ncbi:cathepsin W isoform X2 [Antechinus flavipes]|uniref:cathepsin W isoform X2 n=1 Tax=Antechinus flavipes TaxID=38775 RepID=UPI002235970F|nr:cathepsin W isoform X2 [Antechinus flavipes]